MIPYLTTPYLSEEILSEVRGSYRLSVVVRENYWSTASAGQGAVELRETHPLRASLHSPRIFSRLYQQLLDAHHLRLLVVEGFTPDQFAKVYAPIGLDIGARTPAEIATAIAAEIVDLRRKGKGRRLSLNEFRPGAADGR